jgi:hypothetical protein
MATTRTEWHVNDAENPNMVYVPKDSVQQFMKSVRTLFKP